MHGSSPRFLTNTTTPAGDASADRHRLVDAVETVARGSDFVALSLVFDGGDVVTWPPRAVADDAVAAAAGRQALASHTVVVRALHPGEHDALGVDRAIMACVAMPLAEPPGAALTAWSSRPITGTAIRRAEELSLLLEGPARRHVVGHRPLRRRLHDAGRPSTASALGSCGSLAHELNNVVTALLLDAELLHGTVDADGPAAALVQRLLQSSERAASLGVLLRMASACGGGSADPVALDDLGGVVARRAMSSLPEGVTLSFAAGPGPLRVLGDAEQLSTALDALLRNAIEASAPLGSSVELMIDAVTLLPDAAASIGLPASGRYIRIAVSDSGRGMDEDTLLRCARPFFTTSETSLGLGLSAARGLATSMGGTLTIDSAPHEGTVVELWLPAAA